MADVTVEVLRESEERWRLMVEAVTDYAIFMLDPEGRITSWNSGAERLKGYRAEEIVGRPFSVFYTDADRDRAHPQYELRRAITDGKYEEEGIRVRKDGTRFWASVVITAVFDRAGRHIGFTKVTRDVTERRLAEQALRESEERFRLIIESVRDYAIIMLDPEGIISSWNAGAEQIKGYRATEVLGRHFSLFYRAEDVAAGRPLRELEIAGAEGRYEEEGYRVRKDGTLLWVNVVLTAMRDETGQLRGFTKVTRDLTERRRIEEERRQAERRAAEERARTLEAERAVQQRDEFLSIAAHELRTPLAALQLKLQGAQKIAQRPDSSAYQTVAERLEAAERHLGRLTRLIDRLLDVSRIASGGLELRREEVDLSALVREVVEDFREPMTQAGCSVVFEVPGPVLGLWDRERIEQAVVNLLANALKYGAGRPIEVRVGVASDRAQVSVRDHGIGIGEQDLERIFGRFQRAVPATHYAGLGLGLYITKHIADAHGGDIRIESALGRGSTFVFELPRG